MSEANANPPVTSRAPAETGAAPTDPNEDAAQACDQRVRRAIRHLSGPMWQASVALLASPDGRSAHWARRLPRRVTATWHGLDEDCRVRSSPAEALRQLAGSSAKEQFSLAHLRRVLGAYLVWARFHDVEADAAALLAHYDRCRPRRGTVTAVYRPLWAWTDTGKAHWVQISLTNRKAHPISGAMRGRVWVQALPPRLRPMGIPQLHDPQRGAWALTWGGSSADMWTVPARSTRSLIAPVYFGDRTHPSPFPTGREGSILGVTMSAEYDGRGGRQGCPVLVRPG